MSKYKFKKIFLAITVLFLIMAGFYFGRFTTIGAKYFKLENNIIKPLRMSGYKYTKPLLACDTGIDISSPKMDALSDQLNNFIAQAIANGNLTSASIYIRSYKDGATLNINPEEKYYPASLNKVPVMIAAFRTLEKNPNFLNEKHRLDDSTDYNYDVEIKPTDFLKPGQTYTVAQAIDKMIKNSDNNALFFLYKYIDPKIIDETFRDLKITQPSTDVAPDDYMTVKEYSYFLRVLYNATYISPEYSDKALDILSDSKYGTAIRSGVPQNVTVAHKFGIRTYTIGNKTARELHDCGIVYTKKPYLMCVMTKSENSVNRMENSIKELAAIAYHNLKED